MAPSVWDKKNKNVGKHKPTNQQMLKIIHLVFDKYLFQLWKSLLEGQMYDSKGKRFCRTQIFSLLLK